MKLLRWIDRADMCARHGEARPNFEDENGGFIFPPEGHEDEKWWLTELSLTNLAKQREDDGVLEDGAPSDMDDEDGLVDDMKVNELTSDEETDEDESDKVVGAEETVILPEKTKMQSAEGLKPTFVPRPSFPMRHEHSNLDGSSMD